MSKKISSTVSSCTTTRNIPEKSRIERNQSVALGFGKEKAHRYFLVLWTEMTLKLTQ